MKKALKIILIAIGTIICLFLRTIICLFLIFGAALELMYPSNTTKVTDPYEKILIIGHTAEEIQNVYGEFYTAWYYKDGHYYEFDPNDPENQDVVIRRAEYLVAPRGSAPDYRRYPFYYRIDFNINGDATKSYLYEATAGG